MEVVKGSVKIGDAEQIVLCSFMAIGRMWENPESFVEENMHDFISDFFHIAKVIAQDMPELGEVEPIKQLVLKAKKLKENAVNKAN
jgi:hypothetical protein